MRYGDALKCEPSKLYSDVDKHLKQCQCFERYSNSELMAVTGKECTSYSLQVPHSCLRESLKHFGSVLALPQISSEDVRHEVLSVDAEFQRMKLKDNHRFSHLNLYLSRPNARCTHFFEGDYHSLVGDDQPDRSRQALEGDETCVWAMLRQKVLVWWSENYPRSLKSIVLVGRGMSSSFASAESRRCSLCSVIESLDELSLMAVQYFSNTSFQVPCEDSDVAPKSDFKSPWTTAQEGVRKFN